jgi:hypothetical protein
MMQECSMFANVVMIYEEKLTWIPEPSTVNNKLKRREGSGSTGRFFD